MKFKLIIIFFFILSCAQNYSSLKKDSSYNSKGFAYIYNDIDFDNKIILKKLDNNYLQIAHHKLGPNSLIKIINPTTGDTIILKNSKKIEYPDFYKIMITKPVAEQINLTTEFPLVEIFEVKKNKSFIAKKTKIYQEEKKIYSNAPVETVKIDNISKFKKEKKTTKEDKFYILIAEFYSEDSAKMLKNRINKELSNFDSKKLRLKSQKTNKIKLLSGPYSSINLIKNDYSKLKKFGFEELDISLNE